MIKQIPNLFTLLNLFFGCLAIVFVLQSGIEPVFRQNDQGYIIPDVNQFGRQFVSFPPQIWLASLCIAISAVVDFFDGFVARLLKASSDMGKQLDSLADVVSFGVAPGIIVYEFLRLSYAQHEDGLNISFIWLIPAFIIPCAGAYRLARFNIDTEQAYGFKGVPIPAVGLLIASFPLIFWFSDNAWVTKLLINEWFWYAVIITVSYLMVSKMPMMAMKFKTLSFKSLLPFIIIAAITIVTAIIFGWLAVPVAFFAYVILSLVFKQ